MGEQFIEDFIIELLRFLRLTVLLRDPFDKRQLKHTFSIEQATRQCQERKNYRQLAASAPARIIREQLFALAICGEPSHYRWIKKGRVRKNKIAGLRLIIRCQNKSVWAEVFLVWLPYSPASIPPGMFPRLAYPHDISCSHLLLCQFFQKKIRHIKAIS